MQLGNFIDVFLARYDSGAYAHHQEHWILSCSILFSAPSFWMGGGLESHCVGRVYGADGAFARHHPHRAYAPETYRAKNASIKLPSFIKLAFQFISSYLFSVHCAHVFCRVPTANSDISVTGLIDYSM